MNWIPKIIVATLVGLSVSAPVLAQERHDNSSMRRDDADSRQSRESARREAVAAYAQAKRECARERRDERTGCLRSAREDYDHQMAYARGG